jgi:hypothetical protein
MDSDPVSRALQTVIAMVQERQMMTICTYHGLLITSHSSAPPIAVLKK